MSLSKKILLPAAASLALALPAQAAPAVWEVRDDDSAVHIFGSIHILPEGTDWRTPLFDQLLSNADRVVFETDVSPEAAARIGADAFARGIYTDGTLLTDVIGADLGTRLRQYAGEIGVPVGPMLAMKPWLAANTISVAALASIGFNEQGVEFALLPELDADRIGFLETGAEQLEVMAGAPDDEQVAMLSATLDQIDIMPKLMSKMLSHWSRGTPERLTALFEMEMDGFEAAFLDRLLYERNRNWIPSIEQALADNESAFFIVGAGHLVGANSVIELLETAGYAVTRVQ